MSNLSQLNNIPQDIYNLFFNPHVPSEENLEAFCDGVKTALKRALENDRRLQNKPMLRMSNIGMPDLKAWYTFHDEENTPTEFTGETLIKFLYGDMLEHLLLLLIKEAGYEVTHEQEELTIDGIVGHRDCKINGIPVDIKTASNWSFKKFETGSLFTDDAFGYIPQISAYAQAGGDTEAAFVAINKEQGTIAVLPVQEIDTINAENRIKHLKTVVTSDVKPTKKCYAPVPDGKSGNMKLNTNCTFCKFKDKCWSDSNGGVGLRKFKYANGITHLVEVASVPKVEELT